MEAWCRLDVLIAGCSALDDGGGPVGTACLTKLNETAKNTGGATHQRSLLCHGHVQDVGLSSRASRSTYTEQSSRWFWREHHELVQVDYDAKSMF